MSDSYLIDMTILTENKSELNIVRTYTKEIQVNQLSYTINVD